jgi:hypothetical protein
MNSKFSFAFLAPWRLKKQANRHDARGARNERSLKNESEVFLGVLGVLAVKQ